MGLIPMGQDPLHAYTGHPISYGGTGSYGKVGVRCGFRNTAWKPKDSRLKKCPAMRKAYDDWLKAAKKHIKRFGRTSGCLKDGAIQSAKRLSALETMGKAAWDKCNVGEKAQGVTQQYAPSNEMPGAGAGAIDPFTGLPVDGGMSTVSYEEDDGGSNMGLYIGIIALLGATGGLIWYKKKKAKSKGSKR
jgi:LPXTG-motif cell wall-anchored protein